jgi:uncharacterized protein YqeY
LEGVVRLANALEERLVEDMKAAMKAQDEGKLALSVIRLVRASLQNAAIEKRCDLSDEEALDVLAREVKQRREAAEEYDRLGKPDVVERFRSEVALLEGYLPRQMSLEELRAVVGEAIAATGATSKKEMGKVMGLVRPKTRGRADGRVVSEMVARLLGED